jgi:hypothetical protein
MSGATSTGGQAQSQDPTLTQVSPAQNSQSPGMGPSANQLAPIVVTATRTPPTAPAFPGISGLMDQGQSTASNAVSGSAFNLLTSRPNANTFVIGGALAGAGTGVAAGIASYGGVAAAGEMTLDAFAALPVAGATFGLGIGALAGAAIYGGYLLATAPPGPYGSMLEQPGFYAGGGQ